MKTTNYTSSSMKKVASLFLAPTVAILSLISAHAGQGTEYFQGQPAFDWTTTDRAEGNGSWYEHQFSATIRYSGGSVRFDAISCNNSRNLGPVAERWLGDTVGKTYNDKTPGHAWHWHFYITKKKSYSY
jgi:hypothetical protein